MSHIDTYIDEIHQLFEDPDNWTDHAYARNVEGKSLTSEDVYSDEAVSWCVRGAILKTLRMDDNEVREHDVLKTLNKRARLLGYQTVGVANDVGGYHIIMQILSDPRLTKSPKDDLDER